MVTYTLPTHVGVGRQWTESTSIGCNQWLSLVKMTLRVSLVGRNRSLVASASKCGEGVSLLLVIFFRSLRCLWYSFSFSWDKRSRGRPAPKAREVVNHLASFLSCREEEFIIGNRTASLFLGIWVSLHHCPVVEWSSRTPVYGNFKLFKVVSRPIPTKFQHDTIWQQKCPNVMFSAIFC